jgi:hypothetical protein
VIVSWVDDSLGFENGCIFVPVARRNDFLFIIDAVLANSIFLLRLCENSDVPCSAKKLLFLQGEHRQDLKWFQPFRPNHG